ncbi:hypothetical protein BTJ68_13957 [Hortaea werneckii EXF-2000]|uniref:Xylanolytic transcriptional activator regulatory domain-containing protein n=1 Tax=Hortaea werneckii EXF-2000 TaxID=1157616 RepID=A0A1Z5SS35_HORWE|nr:hypothetical protein BTJ68_13957 [Hortaea werneckii EXF-2000]
MAQSQINGNASDRYAQNTPTIETIQALIVLMVLPHGSLRKLWSKSLSFYRLPNLHNRDSHHGYDREWRQWAADESIRRTKLIAFTFLHTHSIAYNVYPVLRSNEVNLRLPCSTKEWNAPTAALWYSFRRETPKPQLLFQEALSLLLRNRDDASR